MIRDVKFLKKRELTKEKVLNQAFKLIQERKSIKSLTMRELATSLDVQVSAIYWYFKDKNSLIQAMIDIVFKEVNEKQSSTATRETVKEFALHYYQILFKHPFVVEAITSQEYGLSDSQLETLLYFKSLLMKLGVSEEVAYLSTINFHGYMLGTLLSVPLEQSIKKKMSVSYKTDNETLYKLGINIWLSGILENPEV